MSAYHQPVLLEESLKFLAIRPDGIYVDVTYGGGGHSKAILDALGPAGKLFAFDQDQDSLANVAKDSRLQFVQANFRYLKKYLKLYGVKQVDGVLADLGVSSHQLDQAKRGFSYRFDGDLDMRMNQEDEKTAATILNDYSAEALQHVLGAYGEVRNARTLALDLVKTRNLKPFQSIAELNRVIEAHVRGQRLRYFSQVYQALRIEVNGEMDALGEFLEQSMEVLKPGGRLVVISYHSLEDRLVKNFFRSGNLSGEVSKDFYGHISRPFEILTKKGIEASAEELRQNNRARSARLRAAEKK